MITKFMGADGFKWFIGTVEANNDPLMLGRVRVRCHGYHSANPQDVLTEHLPWATVLQPTTSAGLNGGGISPTGIQVGTQVVGFFADGAVAQYPVIFGVLGGINNSPNSPQGALPTNELRERLSQQESASIITGGAIGSLTDAQYPELKNTIGRRESGNNDRAENTLGFIGKYQFGIPALYDAGYVNIRSAPAGRQKEYLNNTAAWTGKNGVTSKESWFSNSTAQEQACDELIQRNYRTLMRLGAVTASTQPRDLAGILMVAHLLGAGGANRYRSTGQGGDAYGTSGHAYYRLGFNSITDNQPRLA